MMPAASTVSNSAFLSELALGADKGTTLWVAAFRGEPSEQRGSDWAGIPYNGSVPVDDWTDRNTYFCVAALKADSHGEILRRKSHFSRLLVLCADDIEPDDINGAVSYIVRTSPGKHQVGIFIDRSDTDAADPALCDAIMQEMARLGRVRLDRSGNSVTRYVRLPCGQNQKPRESGPFTHELVSWAPSARMSLLDACAVLGVDLDLIRDQAKPDKLQRASGSQYETLRQTSADMMRGENWHDGIARIAASLVASGTHAGAVVNLLRGMMDAAPGARDSRWQMRYADIPRAVDSAVEKFVREEAAEDAVQPGGWLATVADWSPRQTNDLTTIKPVEWLVDGWIQRGLAGAMVAEGGTGKTTALILLMCCVATSRQWFGLRMMQAGGSSVLLSLDDSQDDLDATLAELITAGGWSTSEIELIRIRVRLISLRGAPGLKTFAKQDRGGVTPTGTEDQLVDTLRSIPDLRMVTMDTLRMFSGGDSADERCMTIATQALTYMADRLACVVMATHHTGKGQSRDAIDDQYIGAGSSAIGDNLRFVLRLSKAALKDASADVELSEPIGEKDTLLRLSSQRGSLRVRKPDPVYIVRSGFTLRAATGRKRDEMDRLIVRLRDISDALRQLGEEMTSKNKLERQVGGEAKKFRDELSALVVRGWVSTERAGAYTLFGLSEHGREVLQDCTDSQKS